MKQGKKILSEMLKSERFLPPKEGVGVNITEHSRISIFSFIIFMQNYMIKFLHSQCSASLVLLVNRNGLCL